MATIFSTLKSMTKPNEKLFYLTAKTIGREVAIDSFRMLQNEGLKLHAIVISSKAKSCASKMQHCDPEKCSFAKGYFSRLRQAIEDIYTNEILYNQETIMKYALKYNICPFEYSLDLSYFVMPLFVIIIMFLILRPTLFVILRIQNINLRFYVMSHTI